MNKLIPYSKQASNASARFNAQHSVASKGGYGTHETSFVSNEIFYSPAQAIDDESIDNNSDDKDGKAQDLQAIEILP